MTEHPGALRRSIEEEQPLIEDSEEDADAHEGSEYKTHRRARSNTHTSGHTTDSFSSRGDIFPSEDELDDAVPLDDEFTIALERRTTGQWEDHSGKSGSSGRNTRSNSKRPSRAGSNRTASSGKRSIEDPASRAQRAPSETIEEIEGEVPTLDELEREEARLRADEEAEVLRKRDDAKQLAVQRGLAPRESSTSRQRSPSPSPIAKSNEPQMATMQDSGRPSKLRSPASETRSPEDTVPFPEPISGLDGNAQFEEPMSPGSTRPTSTRPTTAGRRETDGEFVPARLPHFGGE